MKKVYSSKSDLLGKLTKGVDILADNVASTLGPKGRNVILHGRGKNPITTKDGVTVAEFVKLADPFENAGVQIIKQAARQTNIEAGDGTTTSTVVARAVLKHARRYLEAGASPIELKRGIDLATEQAVGALSMMAKPIRTEDEVRHVATISANGDESIGRLITMAVDQAGKDGAINIQEARSVDTSLDVIEGFRFDSGYLSPKFITDERHGAARHEDALVLVTDQNIDSVELMMPALQLAARESKPLLVIANDVEGQALAALIMNTLRGSLKVVAAKAPRYGEERRQILEDLVVSVGGELISREKGLSLKDVKLEHLGTAKKIEVLKHGTTIMGGNVDVDKLDKRIDALKVELKQTESEYETARLQERITRLASGVAVISVGAPTEVEMIEKKHRIEDALEAVKSAQQEGVVTGGGVALIRVGQYLDTIFSSHEHADNPDLVLKIPNEDQKMGVEIISETEFLKMAHGSRKAKPKGKVCVKPKKPKKVSKKKSRK